MRHRFVAGLTALALALAPAPALAGHRHHVHHHRRRHHVQELLNWSQEAAFGGDSVDVFLGDDPLDPPTPAAGSLMFVVGFASNTSDATPAAADLEIADNGTGTEPWVELATFDSPDAPGELGFRVWTKIAGGDETIVTVDVPPGASDTNVAAFFAESTGQAVLDQLVTSSGITAADAGSGTTPELAEEGEMAFAWVGQINEARAHVGQVDPTTDLDAYTLLAQGATETGGALAFAVAGAITAGLDGTGTVMDAVNDSPWVGGAITFTFSTEPPPLAQGVTDSP